MNLEPRDSYERYKQDEMELSAAQAEAIRKVYKHEAERRRWWVIPRVILAMAALAFGGAILYLIVFLWMAL